MNLDKLGSWVYGIGLLMVFLGVPWYFAVVTMMVGIVLWDLHDWEIRRRSR